MVYTSLLVFNDNMFFRYRIKLEVFDGYDNTIFMLNDSQVNQIVGIQCEELLSLTQVCVNTLTSFTLLYLCLYIHFLE